MGAEGIANFGSLLNLAIIHFPHLSYPYLLHLSRPVEQTGPVYNMLQREDDAATSRDPGYAAPTTDGLPGKGKTRLRKMSLEWAAEKRELISLYLRTRSIHIPHDW